MSTLPFTPNQLTIARMVIVPLIAFLICFNNIFTTALAFFLFLMAAATDWYDGYLARKTGQTSLFGAIFDAIADKLLVIGCLVALAYVDKLNNGLIFPALVIVLREIFVAGLREFVAIDKAPEEDQSASDAEASAHLTSSKLAKIKTGVQMAAIAILIPAGPTFLHPWFGMLGGLALWVAAGLSAYTAWEYWKTVNHLEVERG